jgi:hypothetical protein
MITSSSMPTWSRFAATTLERRLANPARSYLHVHNASPGCFAGQVERASRIATAPVIAAHRARHVRAHGNLA